MPWMRPEGGSDYPCMLHRIVGGTASSGVRVLHLKLSLSCAPAGLGNSTSIALRVHWTCLKAPFPQKAPSFS